MQSSFARLEHCYEVLWCRNSSNHSSNIKWEQVLTLEFKVGRTKNLVLWLVGEDMLHDMLKFSPNINNYCPTLYHVFKVLYFYLLLADTLFHCQYRGCDYSIFFFKIRNDRYASCCFSQISILLSYCLFLVSDFGFFFYIFFMSDMFSSFILFLWKKIII